MAAEHLSSTEERTLHRLDEEDLQANVKDSHDTAISALDVVSKATEKAAAISDKRLAQTSRAPSALSHEGNELEQL